MGVCSTFHSNPPEWYQSYKCEPRGAIRGKIRVFSKVTSICPLGTMNVCECKCCMVIHAKVVEVFHSGPVGGKQALSRILEDSLTEVMRSWAHCISLHFFRLSDQGCEAEHVQLEEKNPPTMVMADWLNLLRSYLTVKLLQLVPALVMEGRSAAVSWQVGTFIWLASKQTTRAHH